MIDLETLFPLVLFIALVLLQIPWMRRSSRGIANLVMTLLTTFHRYYLQPLTRKWHRASPYPLGRCQLQTEENRGVDTIAERNL